MKKNIIIFDVDGLITYPNFAKRIVRPLQKDGKPFLFWTFNTKAYTEMKLKEIGLSDLVDMVGIIDVRSLVT